MTERQWLVLIAVFGIAVLAVILALRHETTPQKAHRLEQEMMFCRLDAQYGRMSDKCVLTEREYNKFMSGR